MTTNRQKKRLTDVELEMMNIIWRIGPCSVNQIIEDLPKGRDLAYTTVSTMIRILEQKQFVKSFKVGRGHSYQAVVEKKDYQATSIDDVVTNVFDGTASLLVKQLLANDRLSADDLSEIRKLLGEPS
jgi:predicted transcriptional regulator